MDLTAVDYLNHNKPSRFQIVYNLLSLKHQFRVRVKCALADGEEVKSIGSLWNGLPDSNFSIAERNFLVSAEFK